MQVEDNNDVKYVQLYMDIVVLLAKYLDPWDLLIFSQVSRITYRAMRREPFKSLISFPFIKNYKITKEQADCLRNMTAPLASIEKFKLVSGEVGSGKTWVALSYATLKYRKELLLDKIQSPVETSFQCSPLKILIIVPPALIDQWSKFIQSHTNLKVMSNYQSSCFFDRTWPKIYKHYPIFITSNILSSEIQDHIIRDKFRHIIIHDEAHNGVGALLDRSEEVIGFTASIKTFKKKVDILGKPEVLQHHVRYSKLGQADFKTFELKATELTKNLLPIDFVEYPFTGVNLQQATSVATEMFNNRGDSICITLLKKVLKILTYDNCTNYTLRFTDKFNGGHGKRIYYRGELNSDNYIIELNMLYPIMNDIPKIRELANICLAVRDRKEKIILYDTKYNFLVLIWAYLSNLGLNCTLFTPLYSAAERPKKLEKFKQKGDVLLGSIKMLSEGHNIIEANNIAFVRYPSNKEEFEQALGRCHRFPQKLQVHVHMLYSCELEKYLAKQAMTSDGISSLPKEGNQNLMESFKTNIR